MNTKKYIESGIIEKYILELALEAERTEIQYYMVNYPEIKCEFEAIENALEVYANSYRVKAPPHLEFQILNQIYNERSD